MGKTTRKAISKKLRFEVFKRDKFTCQYCGKKAPDVILVIDHIQPVSKKGTNDILNLITSCQSCNQGKSNIVLNENVILNKQRKQLEDIEERKQQIKLMIKWQKECNNTTNLIIDSLVEQWDNLTKYELNNIGKSTLRLMLKKYNFDEIIEAMDIAANYYLKIEDDKFTHDSVEVAFKKTKGICRNKQLEKIDPGFGKLFYIRGILRNRIYVNEREIMQLLRKAYKYQSYEEIEALAKTVSGWTEFVQEIESICRS